MRLDPRLPLYLLMGAALLLAAFVLAPRPAAAQGCARRPEIVEPLKKRFGERPAQIALSRDGRVVEVWVGPNGGWTLLSTSPEGFTCILAIGDQDWETLEAPGTPA